MGRKTHVRSQKPREVVQEVYGWLLGHWAVRVLMFQAATSAKVPPLRLSFTGTLRVIRRAIPKFQRLKSEEFHASCFKSAQPPTQRTGSPFFDWLTVEILDTLLPYREHRCNPRVVKKPVRKCSKKPKHRGTGIQVEAPHFHIITNTFCLN